MITFLFIVFYWLLGAVVIWFPVRFLVCWIDPTEDDYENLVTAESFAWLWPIAIPAFTVGFFVNLIFGNEKND